MDELNTTTTEVMEQLGITKEDIEEKLAKTSKELYAELADAPVENTPVEEGVTSEPDVIEETEPRCPKCNEKLDSKDSFVIVEGMKRKMWVRAGVKKPMIPQFAECANCGNSMGLIGFREIKTMAHTPAGNTELKRKAARKATKVARKRNRKK